MDEGYPDIIWAWQGVEDMQRYVQISVLRHPTVSNLPQMLQLFRAAQEQDYDIWCSNFACTIPHSHLLLQKM